MGAEDAESRFAINLDSDVGEVSAEAASELEQFRQRISSSTDAVKRLQAANRALRGSTDEVKQAKAELKAKLDAERNAISASTLGLLKHGTTYDEVTAAAKKSTSGMGDAVKLAGGPVADIKGKFEALEQVLGGAGGKMGLLVFGAAAAVAVFVTLAAGLAAVTVSLVRFVIGAADAARSLALIREAFTGNAENARNLGGQVDALAAKVPTAKAALNDLAVQLTRTRLSGGAIVDTFNAVGQASAAMGDQVGKQLEDIITRGQRAQRIQINPLELVGTGLRFDNIAGELAKQLHIGVDKAKAALFEGRVKLDDGAKAIRAAVEKRFAEINLRKALSLDVQLEKFKEKLTALGADVNLEPVLKAVEKFFSLFDESTVAGHALKTLVTVIGDALGPAFQDAGSIAQGFFEGLVLTGLELALIFFKLKKAAKDLFGADTLSNFITADDAVTLAKVAVYGLAGAFAVLAAGVAIVTAPIWVSALALLGLYEAGKTAIDWFESVDWSSLGTSIVDGLVGGVKSAASKLTDTVKGLASGVKAAFANALGIHSPSRVMFELGGRLPEGAAGGVRANTGLVTSAVHGMAEDAAAAGDASAYGGGEGAGASIGYSTPPAARAASSAQASGGSQGGAGVSIQVGNITIQIETKGDKADVAAQVASPSFRAQLTASLREAFMAAGVPTQGVPT